MVGRVFAKPVVIGDDVPQEIADLLTDVDTEDVICRCSPRTGSAAGWSMA